MPTYEYKREDGTRFEVLQKMSESPLEVCPTTGQKIKRVVSGGGGVVYKGEGWYVTDYKNGGKKKEEKTESVPKSKEKAETKAPVTPPKND